MKKKAIIKNQQVYISELRSRLGDEVAINDHLEKTLMSCENALIYKDGLLDKAYRKIGEMVVEGGHE